MWSNRRLRSATGPERTAVDLVVCWVKSSQALPCWGCCCRIKVSLCQHCCPHRYKRKGIICSACARRLCSPPILASSGFICVVTLVCCRLHWLVDGGALLRGVLQGLTVLHGPGIAMCALHAGPAKHVQAVAPLCGATASSCVLPERYSIVLHSFHRSAFWIALTGCCFRTPPAMALMEERQDFAVQRDVSVPSRVP